MGAPAAQLSPPGGGGRRPDSYPSASNALAAKHAYRRGLLSQQSGRLYAGYAYAGAGFGESTSDMVFDGYTGVFENGRALSEGERFSMSGSLAVADVDIGRLRCQRQRKTEASIRCRV